MKRRSYISEFGLACLAVATVLAGTAAGVAQPNRIPGAEDYAAFSRFITDRNIFDPNRQPHDYDPNRPRRRQQNYRAPSLQFVGTMSYEKGMFAFFSGNSADLGQVVREGETIQGYTVVSITAGSVVLKSPAATQQFIYVGDGLRQENGKWLIAKAGELPAAVGPAEAGSSSGGESDGSTSATSAPPPSAGEQNDVLKRLMQQREKENQ